jgi:hypothetical protein
MFGMLIGGFMFGIIIGSLSNILATSNPLEIAKQERLGQIAGWLQFRDVPVELKQDIYEYYRHMFSESETGISEREILDVLPHTMAEPLIQHMFGVSGPLISTSYARWNPETTLLDHFHVAATRSLSLTL